MRLLPFASLLLVAGLSTGAPMELEGSGDASSGSSFGGNPAPIVGEEASFGFEPAIVGESKPVEPAVVEGKTDEFDDCCKRCRASTTAAPTTTTTTEATTTTTKAATTTVAEEDEEDCGCNSCCCCNNGCEATTTTEAPTTTTTTEATTTTTEATTTTTTEAPTTVTVARAPKKKGCCGRGCCNQQPAADVVTAPAPKTTIETITENVTRTVIHRLTTPTPENNDKILAEANAKLDQLQRELDAATKTVKEALWQDRKACNKTKNALAADAITEISGSIRMCDCDEADACIRESDAEIDNCMETCDTHLQEFGNQKGSYLECFSKNKEAITEAEKCLFEDKKYCSDSAETKFINATKWDKLGNVTFAGDEDMKDDTVWKKYEGRYNKFQNFFHCTKHCMHQKLRSCSKNKGCAVQMPKHDEFAAKMKTCTQNNVKISNAIYSTCYCLAWTQKVTDLQGSCVFLGNQYYVNKA